MLTQRTNELKPCLGNQHPMDLRLSKMLHDLKEVFMPFWKLWLVYFLIAGASLAVLAFQDAYPYPACNVGGFSYPWAQCWLGSSTRTPWGILTAFFVHTSFQHHYLPNMEMLFALVLVFCVTSALATREAKEFRQRVFLRVMFAAGIVANVASLFLYGPYPTVGASGLGFAAWGLTLVFCITNIVPRVDRFRDFIPHYRNPRNIVWRIGNAIVASVLVLAPVQYPALFLAVAPDVNVLAHFVGIVFAMATAMVWVLLFDRRPDASLSSEERREQDPSA